MSKLAVISIFLCFVNSVDAQRNAIYANLPAVINLYHANVELGFAREFNNGFCSDFGVGVIFPVNFSSGGRGGLVGRRNGRGILLHFEPKYFFDSYQDSKQRFLALKASFVLHNYESKRFSNDNTDQVSNYDVQVKGILVNLLYGFRIVDSHNMFIEMSAGLGVRFLNIDNNSPISIANLSGQLRFTDLIEPEEKGNYARFTMMVNVKVGLAF